MPEQGAATDRSFEGVVVDWDAVATAVTSTEAAALRSSLESLSAAAVHVFLVSDHPVDHLDGLVRARPPGPGRLHLCVDRGSDVFAVAAEGPILLSRRHPAHRSDGARWAGEWLARQGITGDLVLAVSGARADGSAPESRSMMAELKRSAAVSLNVEPDGHAGGVARLVTLLDGQLARRRERRVPWIDEDPEWVVRLPSDPNRQRVAESIGALANGYVGTRAARGEDGPGSSPQFVAAGVYTSDTIPRLLGGPNWTELAIDGGDHDERLLDLRTGVLVRRDDEASLRTLRFVSVARPHAMALRAEAAPAHLTPASDRPVSGTVVVDRGELGPIEVREVSSGAAGIAVACRDRGTRTPVRQTVERLAAWAAEPAGPVDSADAVSRLAVIDRVGFDQLLAEHRATWAGRWARAAVTIDGDSDDELAVRFAMFHLLSTAPDDGEAAVGPRGLTGPAYGGHVFWDADVFVLPTLAAIHPAGARAMIQYRLNRLAAARRAAAEQRLPGARFPWESAADGRDVTPRQALGIDGRAVPILTGDHEEHIVADVAWSIHQYAAWTGDLEVLTGAGRDVVLDTARYWAARTRPDGDGHAHIDGVMGPDEYHEIVDDNAYTNVMARWNLRYAARLVDATGGDRDEAAGWRDVAERLVDGWSSETHLYEQFAGYWGLEPLLAAHVAPPPFAADVVLGADRVAGSQLIKQADVLMLHHLVPDDVAPASLAANLEFYAPRTTHGSSLSPAIHAVLLARAGRPDDALDLFRLAARLDLDDITGTTAGGVHLATMAGVWQAVANGFLGIRPCRERLEVDPHLPAAWRAVSLQLGFHGQQIGLRADHRSVEISCERTVSIRVAGGEEQLCEPPGLVVELAITSGGENR